MKHNISPLTYPPDPERYPLFAKAQPLSCTLRAGEALYIPPRWWHWVTSYDRNIALNFWHEPEQRDVTAASAAGVSGVSGDVPTGKAEKFEEWFTKGEPVLVDAPDIKAWPATTAWSDEYLLAHAGDDRQAVGISPDPFLFPVKGEHRTRGEMMPFAEFLRRSAGSPEEHHYLAQNELIPRRLAGDWSVPDCWKRSFADQRYRVAMWMTFAGADGITSALHFDYYENMLVQVAGHKRVLLFSPAQSPYLYAEGADSLRTEGTADVR